MCLFIPRLGDAAMELIKLDHLIETVNDDGGMVAIS